MSNNNASSPNLWSLLRWVVLVLAPPLASLLPQVQDLTLHNRLLTGIVLALYEVLLFLISFGAKIWQQLEDRWVGQLVDWIDLRKEWVVSRSYRAYCRSLIYQHRDVDVKGLNTQGIYTLALLQVFVELSIVPTPAHQASSDPIRVFPDFCIGTHTLQEYLSVLALKEQHLVIVGPPGSGKSTLLKHLVLTCLTARIFWNPFQRSLWFPVLLFLREHADAIKEKPEQYSLEEAVCVHARKWWRQSISSDWVARQLSRRRCLLCLDGLDEVSDPAARMQVVAWVERQMNRYNKNRFLITSRPHGYRSMPLTGVMVLEVHPFTPKQVEQFVHQWYLANEIMSQQKKDQGVRLKAANGADDLLQRLRATPALYALAVNPLLLTMIATVHRYRDTLPGKRVTLYAEICDVFLGKRDESKGLTLELTAAQKRQVLQPLAYHMMLREDREIALPEICLVIQHPLAHVSLQMTPQVFVSLIEQTSGVFLEREAGSYSFAHLTFQEYLAAVHIKEEQLEAVLVKQVAASWWRETIRLYCAQADATAVLAACLDGNPPSVAALTLAWECQQEALKLDSRLRLKLKTFLNQGIEDADQERQQLVAQVLLEQRLRQMMPLGDEIFLDTSLVTHAEYQLFLDDMYAQDRYVQPDHWNGLLFPNGQGKAPVLGVRYQDAQAFCQWLTRRDVGIWQYRLPKEEEKSFFVLPVWKIPVGYWLGEGYVHLGPEGVSKANVLLNHILIRDLDLIRDLNLIRDPSRDLFLDRSLSSDLDLAHDLVLTRNLALNLAGDLTGDRVRDLALVLDRTLSDDCNLAYALGFDQDLDLDRALNLACALSRDLPSDYILAGDLSGHLAAILAQTRRLIGNLAKKNASKEEFQRLRGYLRSFNVVLAAFSLDVASFSLRRPANTPDILNRSSNYLWISVLLALQEERAEGRLPAWEGILLVKERRKDDVISDHSNRSPEKSL